MSDRNRLDVLLVELGHTDSREQAKKLIKDGLVKVNGIVQSKPGADIRDEDSIEICGSLPYVGRGGLKLEKALARFDICLCDAVCIDIGASTGGFTDCMLQNGASKVYAVDVGSGQLAQKLRDDSRVVNMEKTNFRYLTAENISEQVDFVSADVSFISLRHIIPVMYNFMKENAYAVCLIKPQFEAGKNNVGKNGIVKDSDVHRAVIEGISDFSQNCGFSVRNIDYSPVKGGDGNIEYLICLRKCKDDSNVNKEDIGRVVRSSHESLKNGGAL
ncbi:MAG: TlyA family RNA methyltransferase [Clostridia bacterium]|nr:TlyA family RNA methyltransferase [Clostridia bacterium]